MCLEVSLISHRYRFTMTEDKRAKPKVADTELDKLTDQFKVFDENIQTMTLDRMNQRSRASK